MIFLKCSFSITFGNLCNIEDCDYADAYLVYMGCDYKWSYVSRGCKLRADVDPDHELYIW